MNPLETIDKAAALIADQHAKIEAEWPGLIDRVLKSKITGKALADELTRMGKTPADLRTAAADALKREEMKAKVRAAPAAREEIQKVEADISKSLARLSAQIEDHENFCAPLVDRATLLRVQVDEADRAAQFLIDHCPDDQAKQNLDDATDALTHLMNQRQRLAIGAANLEPAKAAADRASRLVDPKAAAELGAKAASDVKAAENAAAQLAAIDLEIPKAEARVEAARNAMLFI